MSGSILQFKIFTGSTTHALRAICLLTFIPSFALLLVPTIINNAVPVIGIIFLFLSFAFSGFLLAHEKKCGCRNSGLSGTAAHFIIDLFLGLLLLLSTILTWASFGHYDPAPTIVGTYGTVGLIINCAVHIYLALQQLEVVLLGTTDSSPLSCPQCINKPGPFSSGFKNGMRNGYAPLLDPETTPENSTGEGAGNTGDSAV